MSNIPPIHPVNSDFSFRLQQPIEPLDEVLEFLRNHGMGKLDTRIDPFYPGQKSHVYITESTELPEFLSGDPVCRPQQVAVKIYLNSREFFHKSEWVGLGLERNPNLVTTYSIVTEDSFGNLTLVNKSGYHEIGEEKFRDKVVRAVIMEYDPEFEDGFSWFQNLTADSSLANATNEQLWGEFREVFSGLLDGIACLHSHRIRHCDLAPENFLVKFDKDSGKFVVKIIDFGHAEFVPERKLTVAVQGRDEYYSPETMARHPASWSPDLHSTARLMHDMSRQLEIALLKKEGLYNKQLFEGLTPKQVFARKIHWQQDGRKITQIPIDWASKYFQRLSDDRAFYVCQRQCIAEYFIALQHRARELFLQLATCIPDPSTRFVTQRLLRTTSPEEVKVQEKKKLYPHLRVITHLMGEEKDRSQKLVEACLPIMFRYFPDAYSEVQVPPFATDSSSENTRLLASTLRGNRIELPDDEKMDE